MDIGDKGAQESLVTQGKAILKAMENDVARLEDILQRIKHLPATAPEEKKAEAHQYLVDFIDELICDDYPQLVKGELR